ncbi:MAG: M20 family metallopeptidase, partial [Chloroflexota bacterium]
LVNRDCGTYNKAGVDSVGEWIAARCNAWGWEVERFPQTQYGDCWLARMKGDDVGRIMLSGHLDTVYPDGTAAARPLHFRGERILGPGTCDMKAGVLTGMYAMRALQMTNFRDFAEIVFFFSSEEEVGSPVSRALYGPIARTMDAAFVLEAGRANGDIVSARKGAGLFKVRVTGKAAHAGVEPEKGANAILELAHHVIALQQLNGVAPGVTVNVGKIGGGTRTNVVPDEAWVDVDVRATDPAGAEMVALAIHDRERHVGVPHTRVQVEGYFGCPPMPKTAAIGLLVACAQGVARDLGFTVKDTATGGVSDANIIAGLGVPVLDGLGPTGGLDHGPDEYIDADSIVPRTTLVAELMRRVLAMRERLAALKE